MNKSDNNKPVVCVFCSSSTEVSDSIKAAGAEFGRLLAENGFALLYGGTTCGLMKIVADAHKQAGGRLIGVIPSYMIERGINHPDLDELHTVEDLRPRKQAMLEKSDYIVALPGGIGTYDEFFDLLTLKQLKRHDKPMFLLDTDGYFTPLLALFKHGIEQKTIKAEHLDLFKSCASPDELLKSIRNLALARTLS
ncbi:MAG: Lysine decarboxylase family [Candidatus Rifleibacterium amylolyticum]|nr:MAG: Lysine decarboxylase family [Candidatus Rifleibacterium amylolyticum]NLF96563.1 TIGR00730 family Rossman fold protein [Candidatus Riflebacteria bacterium]